jgi:hypothetical protein
LCNPLFHFVQLSAQSLFVLDESTVIGLQALYVDHTFSVLLAH